jgi:5'-phosphate synthase pdxT subunit
VPVGILALQGDFAAHAEALRRAGAGEIIEVRRPEQLDEVTALVLPGGESTTMLKFLQAEGFWESLRACALRRPVFATCAGAILVAREVRLPAQLSLGLLDATVERNAYGRQLESSIREAEVAPAFTRELGPRLEAVLIRAPRFKDLGPGVEVVAQADGEPLLLCQGNLLAASFHPELSPASPIHRWFLRRAGLLPLAE